MVSIFSCFRLYDSKLMEEDEQDTKWYDVANTKAPCAVKRLIDGFAIGKFAVYHLLRGKPPQHEAC